MKLKTNEILQKLEVIQLSGVFKKEADKTMDPRGNGDHLHVTKSLVVIDSVFCDHWSLVVWLYNKKKNLQHVHYS